MNVITEMQTQVIVASMSRRAVLILPGGVSGKPWHASPWTCRRHGVSS